MPVYEIKFGRPNVTDRALRYRAQQTPPEGPKICGYCGSRRNVEIEHISGREEDGDSSNLMWACRSCNTKKGIALRNAGIGRRTKQFNPDSDGAYLRQNAGGARSVGQWTLAVLSAKGESDAMSVRDAVAMIRATSQRKRSEYAQEIWDRRRSRGTDRAQVPF